MESLPPLLSEGLSVVFVGTEPGRESLQLGCYYANPTNGFYRHLHESGFTPEPIAPTEFRQLVAYGIGLDDVYDDPKALRTRIEAVCPRAVCFNSKEALRRFAEVEKLALPWRQDAAGRYVQLSDITWATSDSSWNASGHWRLRLDDLRALRLLV